MSTPVPIFIAVIMIWIVIVMLCLMTYFGHDIRSRGFQAGGLAMTVMFSLGIGFGSYLRKRDTHPVTDGSEASKAVLFRRMTVAFAAAGVIGIVLMAVI